MFTLAKMFTLNSDVTQLTARIGGMTLSDGWQLAMGSIILWIMLTCTVNNNTRKYPKDSNNFIFEEYSSSGVTITLDVSLAKDTRTTGVSTHRNTRWCHLSWLPWQHCKTGHRRVTIDAKLTQWLQEWETFVSWYYILDQLPLYLLAGNEKECHDVHQHLLPRWVVRAIWPLC